MHPFFCCCGGGGFWEIDMESMESDGGNFIESATLRFSLVALHVHSLTLTYILLLDPQAPQRKKKETKCIDISNILVGIDKFPVSQNTRRRDCQWIVMKQCMSQHCTLLWSRKGGGSFLAASMDEEEVAGLGDSCWTQLTLHNSTK